MKLCREKKVMFSSPKVKCLRKHWLACDGCLLSLRFKAAVLWPFHGIFSFLTNSYRLFRKLFLPVLLPWLILSLSFFTSNGAPCTVAKIWILFTRNTKHHKIQHFSRRRSKASKTFKRFFRFSFALQRTVIVIFFNREGLAEEMLPTASKSSETNDNYIDKGLLLPLSIFASYYLIKLLKGCIFILPESFVQHLTDVSVWDIRAQELRIMNIKELHWTLCLSSFKFWMLPVLSNSYFNKILFSDF